MAKSMINLFAIGSVALSFAWVVKTLLGLGPLETKYIEHYFTWIQSGPLQINVRFRGRPAHCRHADGGHRRRAC